MDNGKSRKRKKRKKPTLDKKSMPLGHKYSLKESDKGSYYNQAHVFKQVETEESSDTDSGSRKSCRDTLLESAEESKKIKSDSSELDGEGPCKCAVSVDGSWAHVGYSAKNAFVSVTSIDTGKELDYVTLSNECKGCKQWEREGNKRISFMSEEFNYLQYTIFMGDGDSSAYVSVVYHGIYDEFIYTHPNGPNIIIQKEDGFGHIKGCMGKHLKRLVDQNKGKKLADGKQMTGKGRLTNTLINSFQVFYGMAFRKNKAYKQNANVKQKRKDLKAMEAGKLDSLQYDDSYAKEQYYSSVSVSVTSSKKQNTTEMQEMWESQERI
ncbi:unnamed protein product [Mytilus coruscus]|uniref:Mutator-like transposase domain-containing protein n=1 Tax=Mytilus coruscus TaxID=42192 RepID=A0A6J8BGT4_MYTCO|nr:unnamed protein product [Mytilus coruscus]